MAAGHGWNAGEGTRAGETAIVVGLRAEARLARRLGVPVMIGGGTAAGGRGGGAAGGCGGRHRRWSASAWPADWTPSLRPGLLVVPAAVLCDDAVVVPPIPR